MATKAQRKSELDLFSPLCRRDCKVCNSGHAREIHGLIEAGRTYKETVAIVSERYGFSVSPAALSRHMANYKESIRTNAAQQVAEAYDAAVDRATLHQMQSAILADSIFENIQRQLATGRYEFSVSDWEKVVSLHHRLKSGDDGALDGLMAMFQTAATKHGFSVTQGVLWQPKPDA